MLRKILYLLEKDSNLKNKFVVVKFDYIQLVCCESYDYA